MIAALVALALTGAAHANERRFTYTYDTLVLPLDIVEIEPWVTFRPRHDGTLRMDHRLEFELPVTNRLMTALYLNWSAEPGEVEWEGVSNEWKLNVLSRATNPVGLGLYGEVGLSPSETELEAKVLLDREMGDLLVAWNIVGEYEIEKEEAETVFETIIENDLGLAYKPTPRVSVGAEARSHTEIVTGEGYEHTAFFAGPALSYASAGWWAASTVLMQVGASHEEPGLVLDEHETMEARVLLGMNM